MGVQHQNVSYETNEPGPFYPGPAFSAVSFPTLWTFVSVPMNPPRSRRPIAAAALERARKCIVPGPAGQCRVSSCKAQRPVPRNLR